ncbi:hypothetical protein HMPREF1549_01984 [Actinomyces johnsonii F0510]|uniref:Uncharacterized protein n=1 Tax=Actinomyces johnsonii F0510 TaxID=1227262 RepID=U1RES2_9ACTO|nr:hypothetical protein HMPREF1549_01984 [Actinomyces johnsonii F0510]
MISAPRPRPPSPVTGTTAPPRRPIDAISKPIPCRADGYPSHGSCGAARAADLRAGACAVGEKGVMAGIADGGVALALAIPNMRGLT